MVIIYILLSLAVILSLTKAYAPLTAIKPSFSKYQLKLLPDNAIATLDDIKSQYDLLSNLDDPESISKKSKIEELVQKYLTYKEVKLMMVKLKNMWKGEASERRKERQLKSFVELYRGRLELEEIIKEKLGLAYSKTAPDLKGWNDILKIEAEIAKLQQKIEESEVKLPKGMSTREERFGY